MYVIIRYMSGLTTAYQAPTPDVLMMALYHRDQGLAHRDDLLRLDNQALGELTRQLLQQETAIQEVDDPVAADLGMTHEELVAALQVGMDDLDAGRVMSWEEVKTYFHKKFAQI